MGDVHLLTLSDD